MILVTGASGNVGAEVVRCLAARKVPVRIGARKPSSAGRPDGAEVVAFDFLDASTFRAAARGCEAVFLLRPPAVSVTKNTLNPFIDVARSEGVRQVVLISVAGAADNRIVPHHAVEQHLIHGPGSWTILRPGFFAQNFGDAYRDDIVLRDRLFVPAGKGRVAFIDVRDLAEIAAEALLHPASHEKRSYTLTGPEALSFVTAAATLSSELGRDIVYEAASIPGYMLHLRRRKLPIAQILVQTILHVGLRFGQAETVDGTLEELLGRRPRTFAEYVRDHRALWSKPEK